MASLVALGIIPAAFSHCLEDCVWGYAVARRTRIIDGLVIRMPDVMLCRPVRSVWATVGSVDQEPYRILDSPSDIQAWPSFNRKDVAVTGIASPEFLIFCRCGRKCILTAPLVESTGSLIRR